MRSLKLSADQIITLNDFPLHNEHILKIYFRICEKNCGKIIPPVPLMHKDMVIPHLNVKLKQLFSDFHRKNPKAVYFMLDGSHRTTAATLTKNKIRVMVLENDNDIKKAKKLAIKGELIQFHVKHTIKDEIKELINHFRKKPYFQTVEQKTKQMIKKKTLPKYIIAYHKK